MTDAEKLLKLKELLLTEDRNFAQQILQKLDQLEETVYVQQNLSEKINPILDKKLEAFVVEIPNTLGPTITKALNYEVKNSQETIVDALFPIIGKMIKKYIQQEIKMLSDSINTQVQDVFSVKKYKRKIKSIFTGVSENDMIMAEISKPELQQIFIIEKGSGLIVASFSKTKTIDEDMIAGMLTAIKSFVEDAFNGGNQSLENIEYELYTIQIQNFSTYYIAAVLSGSINNYFKSKIQDDLMEFADKHIKNNIENKTLVAEKLQTYFDHE
jgi:hypothetical protein